MRAVDLFSGFGGRTADVTRGVGNAVPPPLGRAVVAAAAQAA